MKTIYRTLAASMIAALLIGCCSCRSGKGNAETPLIGTTWQLVQLDEKSVTPTAEQYTLTLLPDEGQFAASGDCNRLTGRYVEGERRALNFSSIGSTRMLCRNAADEARYVEMLSKVTRYDLDGKMLLLFSNDTLLAVLQAKE